MLLSLQFRDDPKEAGKFVSRLNSGKVVLIERGVRLPTGFPAGKWECEVNERTTVAIARPLRPCPREAERARIEAERASARAVEEAKVELFRKAGVLLDTSAEAFLAEFEPLRMEGWEVVSRHRASGVEGAHRTMDVGAVRIGAAKLDETGLYAGPWPLWTPFTSSEGTPLGGVGGCRIKDDLIALLPPADRARAEAAVAAAKARLVAAAPAASVQALADAAGAFAAMGWEWSPRAAWRVVEASEFGRSVGARKMEWKVSRQTFSQRSYSWGAEDNDGRVSVEGSSGGWGSETVQCARMGVFDFPAEAAEWLRGRNDIRVIPGDNGDAWLESAPMSEGYRVGALLVAPALRSVNGLALPNYDMPAEWTAEYEAVFAGELARLEADWRAEVAVLAASFQAEIEAVLAAWVEFQRSIPVPLTAAEVEAEELARHAPPAPAKWFCYGVSEDEILAENPRLVRGMGVSLQKHGVTGELMPGSFPLVAVRSGHYAGSRYGYRLEFDGVEQIQIADPYQRRASRHLEFRRIGAILRPDWKVQEITVHDGEPNVTATYPPPPVQPFREYVEPAPEPAAPVAAQPASFGIFGDALKKARR